MKVSARSLEGLWLALAAFVSLACAATPAAALPSFARETQQPCSVCHVGAFGPQLKQAARDFKLFGYTSGIGRQDLKAITLMVQASATHTKADQPEPAAPHTGVNDNLTLAEVSVFFGGKLIGGAGAFAELGYDGVERTLALGKLDIRRAAQLDLGHHDLVVGADLNNSPGLQDLWNSTPVWRFPYNGSPVAPNPSAAARIDGAYEGTVLGLGAYAMLDDTLYLEAAGYRQVDRDRLRLVGVQFGKDDDTVDGVAPYWRIAVQHNFGDRHNLQVGAYGLNSAVRPAGDGSSGVDHFRDAGIDASYQFTGSKLHYVSGHATWINEQADLSASRALSGGQRTSRLQTLRADLSYSYKDAWTPTVSAFRTWGPADTASAGSAPRSPNTSGVVAELAYTPLGKKDSAIAWGNARLALQYVAYTQFDGRRGRASDNNTIYLSLWLAAAPF